MQTRIPLRPPLHRQCCICENLLTTQDPRAKTCSNACRTWMYRAGGPLAAGAIFESWARDHAAAGGQRSAEELRARAERCRALGSQGLTSVGEK